MLYTCRLKLYVPHLALSRQGPGTSVLRLTTHLLKKPTSGVPSANIQQKARGPRIWTSGAVVWALQAPQIFHERLWCQAFTVLGIGFFSSGWYVIQPKVPDAARGGSLISYAAFSCPVTLKPGGSLEFLFRPFSYFGCSCLGWMGCYLANRLLA